LNRKDAKKKTKRTAKDAKSVEIITEGVNRDQGLGDQGFGKGGCGTEGQAPT
jgi:hypothetical protein